jgi:glucosylglycerate phosphorylase
MAMVFESMIKEQLKLIYPESFNDVLLKIKQLIDSPEPDLSSNQHKRQSIKTSKKLSEKDIILITYGDVVSAPGQSPMASLGRFMEKYGEKTISAIHILPCFPYTSDDGFSVVDYKTIDPNLGDWDDISQLANDFNLMLDAVLNHVSSQNHWFKSYLAGDPEYTDFFIEAQEDVDYSSVVRPRDLPLFTKFNTSMGKKKLWTTFSEDQLDLNFGNPKVLLKILDVLIFYAQKGARFIRLDAIGFIWKKTGTTCLSLPETHAIIQVMRSVLEQVVPGTLLITETNVPHHENISYFGNGENEAHLIYQFALPPLVLFSMITGNTSKLTKWAQNLKQPEGNCSFLNFLASHDGIGVRPVEGILSQSEIEVMAQATQERGGRVSWKSNSDGTKSRYELNIAYRDAVAPPGVDINTRVDAMIAANSVLLALRGVPAIYFHSFVGSGNDYKGLAESNINRRINRKKFNWDELTEKLDDKTRINHKINWALIALAAIRKQYTCFSPSADQEILNLHESIFALKRFDNNCAIFCVTNMSGNQVALKESIKGFDLVAEKAIALSHLKPYEVIWCKLKK